MSEAFVSPKTLQIANELLVWAKTYLIGDHTQMKRPSGNQSVCPFVATSMESDAFYMSFHAEINGQNADVIEDTMLGYIDIFKRKTPPFEPAERLKKALLVVFPEIPDRKTFVLDNVHETIKTKFVAQGLMVGQFHKNCNTRSVHNRAFKVSIAPYPLIAIRHMSIHDIIFLQEDPVWFQYYNIRFGEKFRTENLDESSKPLLDLYVKAKEQLLA